MFKFIRLALMLLTFIVTFNIKANAAESVGCGVESECPDGYYCVGAIGQASSGTCVPNSVNITMCRFLDYVQSDILKGLFVFAAVFAGIYMFIGKLTFGTFGQMLIGMAILFGATEVITKITGSDDGICSKRKAEDPASNITGIGANNTGKEYKNDSNIRNLSIATFDSKYKEAKWGDKCGVLDCMKVKCQNFFVHNKDVYSPIGDKTIEAGDCEAKAGETTVENFPESALSGITPMGCARVLTCDRKKYSDVEISLLKKDTGLNATIKSMKDKGEIEVDYKLSDCQVSKITCTPIQASFERDYFKCKNNATDTEFGAEASSKWNIQSCNDLAKKQIEQK